MSQQKLLVKVVRELERLQIPYMVTGSIVSSLQGEPRSTHDIDLVVAIEKPQASALAQIFKMPDYYLDEEAAWDAIDNKIMFGLIEIFSGDKADFWILTEDAFDQSRFRRRRKEHLFDEEVYVSSPEDTILMKLKWAKMSGGSEKQFKDCLRIYEVWSGDLDEVYLEQWAEKLSVTDALTQIRAQAAQTSTQ